MYSLISNDICTRRQSRSNDKMSHYKANPLNFQNYPIITHVTYNISKMCLICIETNKTLPCCCRLCLRWHTSDVSPAVTAAVVKRRPPIPTTRPNINPSSSSCSILDTATSATYHISDVSAAVTAAVIKMLPPTPTYHRHHLLIG